METYTVTVAAGAPAVVAEEGLTLSVLAVNDSRCPVEVRGIWAGHAEVRLKVDQKGASTELSIGTPAPAAMNLAADATYGRYRFVLQGLELAKSLANPAALADYRATVQIEKR